MEAAAGKGVQRGSKTSEGTDHLPKGREWREPGRATEAEGQTVVVVMGCMPERAGTCKDRVQGFKFHPGAVELWNTFGEWATK